MRLPVVIFKVPLDSDKDITASCFSHDTCCFRCKSVSHLPKAWPHYYGWLNPSVIKARVALFEIMLIFLPSCRQGPPVQQRFQYRIAIESVIGYIWMPLLECLTFGRQNIPMIEYFDKTGRWKFHSQLIPLEDEAEQIRLFRIHSSKLEWKEGVLHFLPLPAEGLIDLAVHRYMMPQLHFHVREESAFCCLASVSAV